MWNLKHWIKEKRIHELKVVSRTRFSNLGAEDTQNYNIDSCCYGKTKFHTVNNYHGVGNVL